MVGPQPLILTPQQQAERKAENELCEKVAERKGDELLKQNDQKGAEVAYAIAAAIRIRRDNLLSPF